MFFGPPGYPIGYKSAVPLVVFPIASNRECRARHYGLNVRPVVFGNNTFNRIIPKVGFVVVTLDVLV